jgi:hypothetical protein
VRLSLTCGTTSGSIDNFLPTGIDVSVYATGVVLFDLFSHFRLHFLGLTVGVDDFLPTGISVSSVDSIISGVLFVLFDDCSQIVLGRAVGGILFRLFDDCS